MERKGCLKNCARDYKTYSEQFVTKCLIPFIKKYYLGYDYVFWPDGASSYYARNSIETFQKFNVNYIPCDRNPPNIPQLRPIESFLDHLEGKVYDKDWKANSYQELVSRVKKKFKDFCPNYFENLMSKTKTNLRKAADNGFDYMFK